MRVALPVWAGERFGNAIANGRAKSWPIVSKKGAKLAKIVAWGVKIGGAKATIKGLQRSAAGFTDDPTVVRVYVLGSVAEWLNAPVLKFGVGYSLEAWQSGRLHRS